MRAVFAAEDEGGDIGLVAERVGDDSKFGAGGEARETGAPMRTRIQWVGLLFNRQMNLATSSQPGMGVTISVGVYRRETGKTDVEGEAERREWENLRMPRALLVVLSGKTTRVRVGFCFTRSETR